MHHAPCTIQSQGGLVGFSYLVASVADDGFDIDYCIVEGLVEGLVLLSVTVMVAAIVTGAWHCLPFPPPLLPM